GEQMACHHLGADRVHALVHGAASVGRAHGASCGCTGASSRCIAPLASTRKPAFGGTTVVLSICSTMSGPSSSVPGGRSSRRYTGVLTKPLSRNQTLRVSASARTTLPPVGGCASG